MLVINRGGSGSWHIFRGPEVHDFLSGVVVVATWPIALRVFGLGTELARLFGTEGGTYILCLNNERIPDIVAKALFKKAVYAAEQNVKEKDAAN